MPLRRKGGGGGDSYVHPLTHPATMIVEDADHRFITDDERTAWNAKSETDVATLTEDGLMSSADKVKMDGVEAEANKYIHPDHLGDVTSTGDGATVIGDNKVSNDKLADMATQTVKGRTSAGAGDPEDITMTQLAGMLPDATTTAKGLVELATTSEAQAGTDATRALTPATSGSRTTFAVTSTDDATSTTSASLKTAGGLAVAKSAWVGGDLHFGFSSTSHSFGVTIPSGSLSIDIVDLATLTLLYFSGRIGVFSSENGVTNTLYREYIISKNIDGWNLTPIDGTTIDSGGAPGQVTLSLSGSILTATRTSSSGACFVRVAINRVA